MSPAGFWQGLPALSLIATGVFYVEEPDDVCFCRELETFGPRGGPVRRPGHNRRATRGAGRASSGAGGLRLGGLSGLLDELVDLGLEWLGGDLALGEELLQGVELRPSQQFRQAWQLVTPAGRGRETDVDREVAQESRQELMVTGDDAVDDRGEPMAGGLLRPPGLVGIGGQAAVRDGPVGRIGQLTFTSPFSAAFSLPLSLGDPTAGTVIVGNWPVFFAFMIFYLLVNATLLWSILWLFNVRWRVLT